jgi:hypothetical protein
MITETHLSKSEALNLTLLGLNLREKENNKKEIKLVLEGKCTKLIRKDSERVGQRIIELSYIKF